MNQEEITASSDTSTLAVHKGALHMNTIILDQTLKLDIVLAALDGRITYQFADELIKHLGYRGL